MTTTMTKALLNWQERYNARFIMTFRVRVFDAPGRLAKVIAAIGDAGAALGATQIVDADSTHKVRDLEVFVVDEEGFVGWVHGSYVRLA